MKMKITPAYLSQHVPANNTELQNSNEIISEGDKPIQDQNYHKDSEHMNETNISERITTDVMKENNGSVSGDTNVVAYVDDIGGGDHVNVLAMDSKDDESVYVVVCDEPPVDGGGDGPVRLDYEKRD